MDVFDFEEDNPRKPPIKSKLIFKSKSSQSLATTSKGKIPSESEFSCFKDFKKAKYGEVEQEFSFLTKKQIEGKLKYMWSKQVEKDKAKAKNKAKAKTKEPREDNLTLKGIFDAETEDERDSPKMNYSGTANFSRKTSVKNTFKPPFIPAKERQKPIDKVDDEKDHKAKESDSTQVKKGKNILSTAEEETPKSNQKDTFKPPFIPAKERQKPIDKVDDEKDHKAKESDSAQVKKGKGIQSTAEEETPKSNQKDIVLRGSSTSSEKSQRFKKVNWNPKVRITDIGPRILSDYPTASTSTTTIEKVSFTPKVSMPIVNVGNVRSFCRRAENMQSESSSSEDETPVKASQPAVTIATGFLPDRDTPVMAKESTKDTPLTRVHKTPRSPLVIKIKQEPPDTPPEENVASKAVSQILGQPRENHDGLPTSSDSETDIEAGGDVEEVTPVRSSEEYSVSTWIADCIRRSFLVLVGFMEDFISAQSKGAGDHSEKLHALSKEIFKDMPPFIDNGGSGSALGEALASLKKTLEKGTNAFEKEDGVSRYAKPATENKNDIKSDFLCEMFNEKKR